VPEGAQGYIASTVRFIGKQLEDKEPTYGKMETIAFLEREGIDYNRGSSKSSALFQMVAPPRGIGFFRERTV